MKQSKSTFLVFILYDGIENSVFDSQVLQPLLEKQKKEIINKILLISFEKKKPSEKRVHSITKHPNIRITFLKRRLFLGAKTLWLNTFALKKILKQLPHFYLYARGPHAGWISLHAVKNITNCKQVTIQARGLLAEEYGYAHRNKTNLLYMLHQLRKHLFYTLEKELYQHQKRSVPVTIEAVSPALKDYLIQQFNANPAHIVIAQADIPTIIDQHTKQKWRTETRKNLGIPVSSYVYCYNGSAKPWQCPQKVIAFFKQQLVHNDQLFLLIVSQDKALFDHLLKKSHIDPSRFYVTSVKHTDIYTYLAAADAGLLFREKNCINWVSRPTKALEYQAVGLKIIHNNTVAWLQQ